MRKRGVQVKKLHTNRLLAGEIEFRDERKNRREKEELSFCKTGLEHLRQQLKTIFKVTAKKVGSVSTRNYREWFGENDAEIQKFFQAKYSCHTRLLCRLDDHATRTAYRNACSYVQRRLRHIQDKWWLKWPKNPQFYANTKRLCAQNIRSRLICASIMVLQY